MSAHAVAIAKAALAAALLRPDPEPVARDAISSFHTLLQAVLTCCSPENVQKCKEWVKIHILQSSARCNALGKLLLALSCSMSTHEPNNATQSNKPSKKRQCLHILYLLNDILYYSGKIANDVTVASKLQSVMIDIFAAAASFSGCPKHHRKVQSLLDIWHVQGYYSEEYIEKLRESTRLATGNESLAILAESTKHDHPNVSQQKNRKAPFILPALHGETSTPWFDLPAANMMPHIMPHSSRPIAPSSMRPLQLVAGPADVDLVEAVKVFLADVDKIFHNDDVYTMEEVVPDIDDLGQPLQVDDTTGTIVNCEAYYGWSREFCEKMKQRDYGGNFPHGREQPDRRHSRSSSIRSSSSYASEYDDGRSRSRSEFRRSPRQRKWNRSDSIPTETPQDASKYRSMESPPYSPRIEQDDNNKSKQKTFDGDRYPVIDDSHSLSSHTGNPSYHDRTIADATYTVPSIEPNAIPHNNSSAGLQSYAHPMPHPFPFPAQNMPQQPYLPQPYQQIFHGQFVPPPPPPLPVAPHLAPYHPQQGVPPNSWIQSMQPTQWQLNTHRHAYGRPDRGSSGGYQTGRGPGGRSW